MKRFKIIALIMCLSLFMFGCNRIEIKEKNEEKSNNQEDIKEVDSEYIHLSMIRPDTINPILNKDKSVGYVLNLVYDSLFNIDKDYNIELQLVENYSFSSDKRTMNIKLRDAKWHDGNSIKSSDVKFTIDTIKKYNESPYNSLVQNISSVNIISDKELNINFSETYAFAEEQLIFPIIPQHILSGLRESDLKEYRNNKIGSGPYIIEKYETRKYIILEPNKDYYKEIPKDSKSIKIIIVPDEEAQVAMTMALESDITKVELSDLSLFNEKKFKNVVYQGRGYEYIALNFENKYIQDLNFRKALAYGINKENILEDGYLNNATAVNFPLNPNSKYYDSDIKSIEYDKKKAKDYLSKVNVVEDKNIVDSKENIKINPTYELKAIVNKDDIERTKTAQLVKSSLSEIGIKVNILELTPDEINDALEKKNYDIAFIGWELSHIPDPTPILNYSGYSDEKLKAYLESLLSSSSEKSTIEIYSKLQKHVIDNIPFISLVITNDHIVTNKRINGELNSNELDIYEGIQYLNIEK